MVEEPGTEPPEAHLAVDAGCRARQRELPPVAAAVEPDPAGTASTEGTVNLGGEQENKIGSRARAGTSSPPVLLVPI